MLGRGGFCRIPDIAAVAWGLLDDTARPARQPAELRNRSIRSMTLSRFSGVPRTSPSVGMTFSTWPSLRQR